MTPEIIFGPPGTGKTTALLEIVDEELRRGVPPAQIGFTAFTRRAATEAIERACREFDLDRDAFPNFRTLHSACFRALGLRRGDVIGPSEIKDFANHVGIQVTGRFSEDGTMTGMKAGDRILFLEHKARIRGMSISQQYCEDVEDLPWREVDRVARAYAEWKEAKGLLDFTDMLTDFAGGVGGPRLRSLIVDECFPGDTLITIGTRGERMTIREIVETGYTGPILTYYAAAGRVGLSQVVGHKRALLHGNMIRINFGNAHVVCTTDHRIWAAGGYCAAGDLRVGMHAMHYVDGSGLWDTQVYSFEEIIVPTDTWVYDLSVAGTNCYFANGMLVHNCQDLSALQWKVVDRLSAGCDRLCVAGDDDQCIYRWAGADADRLISMEGSARVLPRSWRVPRKIQGLAQSVISRIKSRKEKEWSPRDVDGEIARVGDISSCDVSLDWDLAQPNASPVLILARNGYLLDDVVEPMLRRRGVLYERDGNRSVRASVLAGIVAWEDLRAGRPVTASRAREAYELMSSGRGVARGHKRLPDFHDDEPVDLERLEREGGLTIRGAGGASGASGAFPIWHEALDRIPPADVSYVLAMRRAGERVTTGAPRVRISTIHGAKGAEARHVILLTEMARRTYREMEVRPDDERRVWYVGITRAREKLTIVSAASSMFYRL